MLIGAGLVGPVTSFAQKTFEKPTTDTGPVEVRQVGPIEARLLSPASVDATQAGHWSVSIDGRPAVRMPAPGFVKKGDTFHFRWTAGETETYEIVAVGNDGWVLGELVGARPRIERWLNPTRAISIERANR